MTIKNIYQDLDLDDQDFKQDYIIFHNIYNTTAATAVECTTYDSYTKSIFRSKKYIWVENISDHSKIGQKRNFSSIFSMKPIYY
jgi:hypothetical protein